MRKYSLSNVLRPGRWRLPQLGGIAELTEAQLRAFFSQYHLLLTLDWLDNTTMVNQSAFSVLSRM